MEQARRAWDKRTAVPVNPKVWLSSAQNLLARITTFSVKEPEIDIFYLKTQQLREKLKEMPTTDEVRTLVEQYKAYIKPKGGDKTFALLFSQLEAADTVATEVEAFDLQNESELMAILTKGLRNGVVSSLITRF